LCSWRGLLPETPPGFASGIKLVEEWANNDYLSMMRQQGWTFVPPEPKK
jgi:hypothetical protein